MRIAIAGFFVFLVGACRGPDRTITRGADDLSAWERRLAAAVPVGMPEDSALATMRANGFQCDRGTEPALFLSCRKQSSGDIVVRKWQAVISLSGGRVIMANAFTGLVGP